MHFVEFSRPSLQLRSGYASTLHSISLSTLGLSAAAPPAARGSSPPSPFGLRRDSLRSLRWEFVALACRAEAREASEGWWARQDSNLQPDRYERPALTIELQAPPRAAATGRQRCGLRLQPT